MTKQTTTVRSVEVNKEKHTYRIVTDVNIFYQNFNLKPDPKLEAICESCQVGDVLEYQPLPEITFLRNIKQKEK